MSYRPPSYSGCATGTLLFAFIGLPLNAVMLLGERACDIHVGEPCAISWGWMKLLTLAITIAICATLGVVAGMCVSRGKEPRETKPG